MRQLRRTFASVSEALDAIRRSDRMRAFDAAHFLMKGRTVRSRSLREIVFNKTYKEANRIAAIYTIGGLARAQDTAALIRILTDRKESEKLRSQAAEALGYVRDNRAIPSLS